MEQKPVKVNEHALQIIGVTLDEYLEWCNKNNYRVDRKKTKVEFFNRVKDGRIARDGKTGKLVNKRIKNNVEEVYED